MTTTPITMPATSRRAFLASAATLALAGCGSLLSPSNPPNQIYVLDPPFSAIPGPAVDWALVITQTDVPSVYDTERLALKRNETMDYYANTQWTDSTPRLLQSLMVEAFEKSGRIQGVARDTGGVHGDFILAPELRHFEALYDQGDGAPRIDVNIVVKLLSLPRREVLATHDAFQRVRAGANSVPAVVQAFNQATGAAIEDIVQWTLGAGTTQAPAPDAGPAPAPPMHRRRHRPR
ncbi:MAG TPA: ABC-type transport auxiliary lipoprotein family protein [Rhizomicrobium sp.]|nr:ABC-type transport auxiliary lipoprotein family protein [Rhizomicrobium sp.]